MGIYASMAKIMIENRAAYVPRGRAVTLGVHHFNYNLQELESIFAEMAVEPNRDEPPLRNERSPRGALWRLMARVLPIQVFARLHALYIEDKFQRSIRARSFEKL